jgi:putative ABC transport system permease protein
MDLAPSIRITIAGLDRNQPVAEVETIEELLTRSTAIPRFTTAVIAAVSGIALLIAVVGVYGLLAYTIAQRVPEFGIQLTLGASPLQLTWLLLRQTMLRVLLGAAAGLFVAWWLSRWLESLLFGVRPHDVATFTGATGILVLASLAAVLVPARRAMKIDPTTALRVE